MLERLLERPGTTRIARPAHDVIAAVGAVTASRASHVLAVVLVLMSAGSESGGARGDWPPWPEGWCGKPWGPRQPARRAFPCVGRACAAIRKWHKEGKLCQRMCDETCKDAEGKWQRMCDRCANEEDAASTGSRQHCATLACTHARPRARAVPAWTTRGRDVCALAVRVQGCILLKLPLPLPLPLPFLLSLQARGSCKCSQQVR